MTTSLALLKQRPALVAAAAMALIAFQTPVYAMSKVQAATQDEQRVIDDIVHADTALMHGRTKLARSDSEKAETVLLNAQQAGTYQDPKSLAALIQAHADLIKGQRPAAQSALNSAESNLFTPGAG